MSGLRWDSIVENGGVGSWYFINSEKEVGQKSPMMNNINIVINIYQYPTLYAKRKVTKTKIKHTHHRPNFIKSDPKTHTDS